MAVEAQLLEKIVDLAEQLSPEYRLRLIQRITESLLLPSSHESAPLQYGKYKGSRMSTLEDFSLAEWRPTDKELNGE